jgi:hypothetical protein
MPASRWTQTATEATERLAARRYAAILSDSSGAVHLDELKALAREWRVAAVLAKPFLPAALVAAVQEAIASDEKP